MIAAYTPPRVPAPGGNSRYFGQPYLTGGKEVGYKGKSFGGFGIDTDGNSNYILEYSLASDFNVF